MANLEITTTTNTIKVDFNALAGDYEEATWAKDEVSSIIKYATDVVVKMKNDQRWLCSFDATKMEIDTIDAVAPTSNADLYTKLIALIA